MLVNLVLLTGMLVVAPASGAELKVPEGGFAVSDDPSFLPEPVRAKRDKLLAAAKSGDISKLKAILEAEPLSVTVSFGMPEDPISFLKETSADKQGVEILARLAEALEAPYAASDEGAGEVFYTWPYLALERMNELTPEQQVDAIRLVGYDALKEFQQYDAWYGWRVGIADQGEWLFFVAGD